MSACSQTELLQLAELSLSRMAGGPTKLADPQRLPSPHLLFRCKVIFGGDLPDSVIVKMVTAKEFTDSPDSGPSHRSLNEVTALEFLGDLSDGGPWPQLISVHPETGLVVMEDLGAHPSIEDVLFGDSEMEANRSLSALGATLGALHGLAHPRIGDFLERQAGVRAVSPRSDSSLDLRTEIGSLEHSFDFFGVSPPSGFRSALEELESAIHGPGPFRTLLHGDAGPQNFMWMGATASVLDFEFVVPGYGLLDVVGARLGFPQSEHGHVVPAHASQTLEHTYRENLMDLIPQLRDDDVFARGLTDACAHWALSRWSFRWRQLFGDEPPDATHGDIERNRAQAITVFKGFVELAEQTGYRSVVADAFLAWMDALRKRGFRVVEMPPYPAFNH